MKVLKAVYKSPEPLVFRKPSNMSIGKYAPGSIASSLPYPWPSTLAGAMAYIEYISIRDNPQNNSGDGECIYSDIDGLLKRMYGDYKLYTGLALDLKGNIVYYTPYGYAMRSLLEETIRSTLTREMKLLLERGRYSRPGMHSRIRISLNREEKTVLEKHLFQENYIDPLAAGLSYLVLVKSSTVYIFKSPVKLGGRGRIGLIETSIVKDDIIRETLVLGNNRENCMKWGLALMSPALLDESPWDEGDPVVLDEEHTVRLAKLLLNTETIGIASLYVPKEDPIGLRTILPGWSTADGIPRKPMLYIPPGTIIEANGGYKEIENSVDKGIGRGTRIGWGTTVAVCLE